ncbi:hypothetical protein CSC88_31750 [Klebsiella pneumoniae]|nr:hypothetical protein CSC88_31750 [Klebsiella pneumoniae]
MMRGGVGEPQESVQNRSVRAKVRTKSGLVNALLSGGDTLMVEVSREKGANGERREARKEINEATHR